MSPRRGHGTANRLRPERSRTEDRYDVDQDRLPRAQCSRRSRRTRRLLRPNRLPRPGEHQQRRRRVPTILLQEIRRHPPNRRRHPIDDVRRRRLRCRRTRRMRRSSTLVRRERLAVPDPTPPPDASRKPCDRKSDRAITLGRALHNRRATSRSSRRDSAKRTTDTPRRYKSVPTHRVDRHAVN